MQLHRNLWSTEITFISQPLIIYKYDKPIGFQLNMTTELQYKLTLNHNNNYKL